MSAFAVVNPRSGNGRTGREWQSIHSALSDVYPALAIGFTTRSGEGSKLARAALKAGHSEIVAVGGDGTINEVVNGMFDADGPVSADAVLSFVTSGTGGDFRKTFGIEPGVAAACQRLRQGRIRPVDVGRVSCVTQAGAPALRYFINIASFGLSGAVVSAVNRARIAKLLGGQFAFAFHSVKAAIGYRNPAVRLLVDGVDDEITTISTVAIANGVFFGGGMKVAPNALPDDGLFDIVIMGGLPRRQSSSAMKALYAGEHILHPYVRVLKGRRILAAPVAETRGRAVLIETDGEPVGCLPASFEILPRTVNLRC